jgi:hypothetical protein
MSDDNKLNGNGEIQPPTEIQKVIDAMPGIVGGLDAALVDHVGAPVPFVIIMFVGKTAAHATNFDPKIAMDLTREFAAKLDKQGD